MCTSADNKKTQLTECYEGVIDPIHLTRERSIRKFLSILKAASVECEVGAFDELWLSGVTLVLNSLKNEDASWKRNLEPFRQPKLY